MTISATFPVDASGIDGETISLEATNISGVPVSGCPIGETWEKEGEGGEAFESTEWSSPSYVSANKVSAPAPGANEKNYIYGEVKTTKAEFAGQLTNSAGYILISIGSIITPNQGIKVDLVYAGASGTRVNLGPNNTADHVEWTNEVISISLTLETSGTGVQVTALCSGGGVEDSVSKFYEKGGDWWLTDVYLQNVFSNNDSALFSTYIVASSGLPNQCTGEVPEVIHDVKLQPDNVTVATTNPALIALDGSMDGKSLEWTIRTDEVIGVIGCDPQYTFYGRGAGFASFAVSDWDYYGGVADILGDGSTSFNSGVFGNITNYANKSNLNKYTNTLIVNVSANAFTSELAFAQLASLDAIFHPYFLTSASGLRIRDAGWGGETTPVTPEWLDEDVTIAVEISRTGGDICVSWTASGGGVSYTSQETCLTDSNIGSELFLSVYRTTSITGVNKSQCKSWYFVGEGFESQCTGETPIYDSITSDLIPLSVLHFLSQPPANVSLVEGETLLLDYEWGGVSGSEVGCKIGDRYSNVGKNITPFNTNDFNTTPIIEPDGTATLVSTGEVVYVPSTTPSSGLTISELKCLLIPRTTSSSAVLKSRLANFDTFHVGFYWTGTTAKFRLNDNIGGNTETPYREEYYNTPVEIVLRVDSDYIDSNSIRVATLTVSYAGMSDTITIESTYWPSSVNPKGFATSGGSVSSLVTFYGVASSGLDEDCTGIGYESTVTLKKGSDILDGPTVTTDTTYQFSKLAELDDSGDYTLTVENDGRALVSDVSAVTVGKDFSSMVTYEPDTGDPKMFQTADGFSLKFEGGVPVMEKGFENSALLSIGTEDYYQNPLATQAGDVMAGNFIEESKKAITINQIRVIEEAAKQCFLWMITDGLAKSVDAVMSNVTGLGYKIEISIVSPTDEKAILIYNKNGENWVLQQQEGSK